MVMMQAMKAKFSQAQPGSSQVPLLSGMPNAGSAAPSTTNENSSAAEKAKTTSAACGNKEKDQVVKEAGRKKIADAERVMERENTRRQQESTIPNPSTLPAPDEGEREVTRVLGRTVTKTIDL